MTERTSLLQEVGQTFRDNGLTAAITALVGGCLAVAATVTRKAFTNEAMLERLDRELLLERERIDKQRAEPLIVRSGYRSPSHNRAVGGAPASKHMLGTAFDIAMSNHDPVAFAEAARAVGFLGFGT